MNHRNRAAAAAILMGGQGRRMNRAAKYALKNKEGIPCLCLLMEALAGFEYLYLSAANAHQLKDAAAILNGQPGVNTDFTGVIDNVLFMGAGPLAGLYAVLSEMVQNGQSDWLFVTACDMPGLTSDVLEKLKIYLDESADCVICQDQKGRIHPLCGYYHRRILPVIREMLERKDYRLSNLLIRSRCRIVPGEEPGIADSVFENMNTPEDLKRHREKTKTKILCVCGIKNSGKTTYIERLVRALTAKGKQVAVIKHDGHDFEGDRPGTDTYRHHRAGAYGTAVYSSARYMVNKVQNGTDVMELVHLFPEADLILIEGMKGSAFPKIELIRQGISDRISCNRENLLAVVTDWPDDRYKDEGVTVWSFDDLEACLNCIENY